MKSEARETIDFVIRSILTEKGLTVAESQAVVDAIVTELFRPDLAWALRDYLSEITPATTTDAAYYLTCNECGRTDGGHKPTCRSRIITPKR